MSNRQYRLRARPGRSRVLGLIGVFVAIFLALRSSHRSRPPAPIVTRLNGEIGRTLQDAEIIESLRRQGLEPLPSTPEEFARYMKSEIAKWSKVIRAAGLQPE